MCLCEINIIFEFESNCMHVVCFIVFIPRLNFFQPVCRLAVNNLDYSRSQSLPLFKSKRRKKNHRMGRWVSAMFGGEEIGVKRIFTSIRSLGKGYFNTGLWNSLYFENNFVFSNDQMTLNLVRIGKKELKKTYAIWISTL